MRLTRRERWRAFFTGRLDGCVPRSRLDLELKIMNGWGLEMDAAKARVDQLEPALFECLRLLRHMRDIGMLNTFPDEPGRILNRIQIPDEELPTEGYPDGK